MLTQAPRRDGEIPRAYRRGAADFYAAFLRRDKYSKRVSNKVSHEAAKIIAYYIYPRASLDQASPPPKRGAYIDAQARLDMADLSKRVAWYQALAFSIKREGAKPCRFGLQMISHCSAPVNAQRELCDRICDLPPRRRPETIAPRPGHIGPLPAREVAMQIQASAQKGTKPQAISSKGPRTIALVGPFQSGKTTLLEAILARTGAIPRQGTVEAGHTVGDASKEARHHKMSVEATFATTEFMGDIYTFIDCPGSIEFIQDMRSVLPAVDAAVVVCEADDKKVPQLQLILRELEDRNIPHFLFLNKIDKADRRVRETIKLLQPASRIPLLLRQIPIWNGDIVSGFVDLALERAHVYREHAASEVI